MVRLRPVRAARAGNLVTAPRLMCVLLVTRPKDSAVKGQDERPGAAPPALPETSPGPPSPWRGGRRLGGTRSGSRRGLRQCRSTHNAQSQSGASKEGVGTPARRTPRPRNSALQGQGLRDSAGGSGSGSQGWRQPDAGRWVGLCQHVVSGFPTWSLSHGRSGCPHSVLASGQSGHAHEGCGPSTRIPAQQVEPLCSATSFMTRVSRPLPQPRGRMYPVSHRLSTEVPRSRCKKSTWNWRCHRSQLWKMQLAPWCPQREGLRDE